MDRLLSRQAYCLWAGMWLTYLPLMAGCADAPEPPSARLSTSVPPPLLKTLDPLATRAAITAAENREAAHASNIVPASHLFAPPPLPHPYDPPSPASTSTDKALERLPSPTETESDSDSDRLEAAQLRRLPMVLTTPVPLRPMKPIQSGRLLVASLPDAMPSDGMLSNDAPMSHSASTEERGNAEQSENVRPLDTPATDRLPTAADDTRPPQGQPLRDSGEPEPAEELPRLQGPLIQSPLNQAEPAITPDDDGHGNDVDNEGGDDVHLDGDDERLLKPAASGESNSAAANDLPELPSAAGPATRPARQTVVQPMRRLPPVSVQAVTDRDDPSQLSPSPFPTRDAKWRDSPALEPSCSNDSSQPPSRAVTVPPLALALNPDPPRSGFPLEQVGRPEDSVMTATRPLPGSPEWQPVEIPVGPLATGAPDRPLLSDKTAAVVSRQVTAMSQQAEDLASRGAHFAARAEMIKALRVITQALDSDQGVRSHSKALSTAMRTLQEAEDFAPEGSALEADLNLERLIDSHRTPILKDESLDRITPVTAQQRYLIYAQEQFVAASGRLPAASQSLFDLGRIYMVLGDANAGTRSLHLPKAVALFQAALMVDARNVPAANELGVLLARSGQLEDARDVFLHGISVQPKSESWHNLAVVHQRLGDNDLADRAQYQARLARTQQTTRSNDSGSPAVRWVDPQQFSAAGRTRHVYQ